MTPEEKTKLQQRLRRAEELEKHIFNLKGILDTKQGFTLSVCLTPPGSTYKDRQELLYSEFGLSKAGVTEVLTNHLKGHLVALEAELKAL